MDPMHVVLNFTMLKQVRCEDHQDKRWKTVAIYYATLVMIKGPFTLHKNYVPFLVQKQIMLCTEISNDQKHLPDYIPRASNCANTIVPEFRLQRLR